MLVWAGRFAITENERGGGFVASSVSWVDTISVKSDRRGGGRSGKPGGEWKHEDERKIMSRIV